MRQAMTVLRNLICAVALGVLVPGTATAQDRTPDLAFVGSVALDPGRPVQGVAATATVTVRNAGSVPAGAFSVVFQPSGTDFPQFQAVDGLAAGEERTLSFTATYGFAGSYRASATLDPWHQVGEGPDGEDDNTTTTPVTVVPQTATVDIRLDRLDVLDDLDEVDGDRTGEWSPIFFAAYAPGATCDVSVQRGPLEVDWTIPDLACTAFDATDVQTGAHIVADRTLTASLGDALSPLIAVVTAFEADDPAAPDFAGIATFVAFRPDYLRLSGLQRIEGQGCSTISVDPPGSEPVGDGRCFDALLDISTRNVVGPALSIPGRPVAGISRAHTTGRRPAASIRRAKVGRRAKRAATRRLRYVKRAAAEVRRAVRGDAPGDAAVRLTATTG